MAWYYNCYHNNIINDDCKVKVWKWDTKGISSFKRWAKKHNIKYKHQKDQFFGDMFDEITFYGHWADVNHGENVMFRTLDEDSVIIYQPRFEKMGCFPLESMLIEDFHKEYIWHKEGK